MTSPRLVAKAPLLAAVCLSVALSGCGRKGDLEPPPGSNLPKASKTSGNADASTRPEGAARAPEGAVIAPKASFPLDPLL